LATVVGIEGGSRAIVARLGQQLTRVVDAGVNVAAQQGAGPGTSSCAHKIGAVGIEARAAVDGASGQIL
jgi:hypothetical protein